MEVNATNIWTNIPIFILKSFSFLNMAKGKAELESYLD